MNRTRVKEEEESSSGEGSEVDSDEFEDETDEEEWLPSGHRRRRPQRAAGLSSSSEESDESENPPKLVPTKETSIRTVHPGPFPACDVCGMKSFLIRSAYESHLAAHRLTGGFVCSLCGLQRRDHQTRERHERQVHFFWRPKEDRHRKEAIQIKEELRAAFWQIGMNIDEVQRAAVLSETNTDVFTPVVYERKRPTQTAACRGRRRRAARETPRPRRSASRR
ncbi:hypothetical protein M3Y99_01457700 [Aphelenchoides fujianensis]|nr:hypothetical protein M3Y99_01457700 [Aphelenchoides fujianensis]